MSTKHWLNKDANNDNDSLSMITAQAKSSNRASGRLSDFVRPAATQGSSSNGGIKVGGTATTAPKRPSLDDDRRGSRKGGMPPSSAFAKSAAGMFGGSSTNTATTTNTSTTKANGSSTTMGNGIGSVGGGRVRFGDDLLDEKKEADDYDSLHKSRVPSNKRASGHIGALALTGGLAGGRVGGSGAIGATPQVTRKDNTTTNGGMPPGEKKGGGAVSRFGTTTTAAASAPSDSLTALMSKPKDTATTGGSSLTNSGGGASKMKESASTKSIGRTNTGTGLNMDRVTPSPQPTTGGTYQLPSSLLNLSSSSAFSPRTSSSFASAALSSLSPFAPSSSAGSSFSAATSPTHHGHSSNNGHGHTSFPTTTSHHHAMAGPVVSTRPRPNASISAPTSHVTSPTGGAHHSSSLASALAAPSSSSSSSASVALPLSLLSPSLLSTLDSPSSSPTPDATRNSVSPSPAGMSFFPGGSSGITATLPSVLQSPANKKSGAAAVAAAKAKAAAAAAAAASQPKINEPVIDQPFARMLVEMSHEGTWLGPTTTMLAQSDTDWKNGLNALVALVLSPTSPLPAPVLYRVAQALLTSLARALKGGLTAAEAAATAADRSQPWDKKLRDGMIRNINRELMTQESLLRPGGLTGTDLAPSLPAHRQLVTRVMNALAALHDANTQARTVPQHIFKSPALNNTFRIVLGAAWRGDPITGALPNGIGEALAAALLVMPLAAAVPQPWPASLLVVLDGYTKAMLMHSSLLKTSAAPSHGSATDGTETLEGAGAGVRRLGLAVSRDRAGAQAVDIIQRERLLPEGSGSDGPLMAILKPYFHASFVAGANAIKEANMSARDKRTDPVEEGEGHGPRKEFFSLVSQQITSESFDPPLFQYRRSCEGHWFHPDTRDTLQSRTRYTFFGWLIGACLLHRSQFSVVLPRVFFNLLLRSGAAHLMGKTYTGSKCGLADLGELDPQLLKSAMDIKSMDSGPFKAFLEAQGVEKPHTVTQAAYVADMAHRFLVEDIKWQMACVWRGFSSSLGPLGLELLRKMAIDAVDLADLVCGSSSVKQQDDFDVQQLFRLVTDGDVAEYPQLIKALWQVISAWSPAKKRLFLKFVTGIDKLPAPLTEELVLELPFFPLNMDDHKKMLMTLPQSHTCTNTLEMPNYWESIKALHGAGVLDLSEEKAFLPDSKRGRRKGGSETGRSTNSSNGTNSGRAHEDDDDDADGMDSRLLAKLRAIIDDRLTIAIENTDGYGLDSGVASATFSTSGLVPSAYHNGVGRLGTTVITPNMPAVTRFGSPARFSSTLNNGTPTNHGSNNNNNNANQPSFGSLHGLRTNVSNSGPSSTVATPGRSGLHTPISGRPNTFMPSSGTRPTSGSPIDDVDEDDDVALMGV